MGLFDRLFSGGRAAPGHLERALTRCNQERSVEAQAEMLDLLFESKLFVPSLREPEQAMQAFSAIIQDTARGPAMVVFTAPERMDPETAAQLGARSGTLVETRWLLEQLTDELGLFLNPNLPALGLLLPADGLARFRKERLGK